MWPVESGGYGFQQTEMSKEQADPRARSPGLRAARLCGGCGKQTFPPPVASRAPTPEPGPLLCAALSSESHPELTAVLTHATLSCAHLLRHLSPLAGRVQSVFTPPGTEDNAWRSEELEQLFVGGREGRREGWQVVRYRGPMV